MKFLCTSFAREYLVGEIFRQLHQTVDIFYRQWFSGKLVLIRVDLKVSKIMCNRYVVTQQKNIGIIKKNIVFMESLNTYLNMFNCTWMNFISSTFIWSMMTSEVCIWTYCSILEKMIKKSYNFFLYERIDVMNIFTALTLLFPNGISFKSTNRPSGDFIAGYSCSVMKAWLSGHNAS